MALERIDSMFAIQKVCLLKPPAYRFDFAENSLPDLGQLIHLWTSVSVTNHPSRGLSGF